MLLLTLLFASMVPVQLAPGGPVNGAGVLIHESLVLTAYHVVDHAPVVGVRCGSTDIPAAVAAFNPIADLALLELAFPCNMKPSTMAVKNRVPGDVVIAEGCPGSMCGFKLYGHVVGYMPVKSPVGIERNLLITDAHIWFGNSGGPLFDKNGYVVGIASQLVLWSSEDAHALISFIERTWPRALTQKDKADG